MIDCPEFKAETPIYFAFLRIVGIATLIISTLIIISVYLKCPKQVTNAKWYFIIFLTLATLSCLSFTEGK